VSKRKGFARRIR